MNDPFAAWITGPPASGKSTLARAIRRECAERGVDVAILESDELRKVLTPSPRFDDAERDAFYAAMLYIGRLLQRHGVPVLFDATARRRRYRDEARRGLPAFSEIFVDCPLELREARDPKGLYRRAREGTVTSLPGFGAEYEAPLRPEFVVRGDLERPEDAARRIVPALLGESRAPSPGP